MQEDRMPAQYSAAGRSTIHRHCDLLIDELFFLGADGRETRQNIDHGLLLSELRSLKRHRLLLVGLELIRGFGQIGLRVGGIGRVSIDEIAANNKSGGSGRRQRLLEKAPPIDLLSLEGGSRTDETSDKEGRRLHFDV